MRVRTQAFLLATVVALGGIAVPAGDAEAQRAGREYSVRITSAPSGAKVFIDDRDAGPVGETPHDHKLTVGKHTVYVELDGRVPAAREINVRRSRRRQTFYFELEELQNGSIEVVSAEDETADGAEVLIDGDRVGVVPDLFDVPEGEHAIEVVKDGFAPFKKTVKVVTGESEAVVVALEAATVGDGGGSGSGTENGAGDGITKPAGPVVAAGSLVTLGAGLGAGTRNVLYDHIDPDNPDLRDFELPLTGLAHLGAELHLGRLVPALRNASLFGQFFISAPIKSSTDDGAEEVSTLWLRREVGVRYAQPVGPVRILVELAEGGDALTFSGFDETVIVQDEQGMDVERETLPDITYEFVRAGLGLGARVSEIDLHAQADGVFVIAAGDQLDVFGDDTEKDIVGLAGRLVARRRIGAKIDAAASVTVMRFSYEFANRGVADPEVEGGTDQMIGFGVSAGYAF